VTAYNDIMAIVCPCKIDLRGGIKGDMLMSVLSKSRAKDIQFDLDENQVRIKAGKSSLKFPVLDEEDFLFELPTTKEAFSFEIKESFVEGIDLCLLSVGDDITHPSQMGVTIKIDKDIKLFSTANRYTMSRYEVDCKEDLSIKVTSILPSKFCEQLVKLYKNCDGKKAKLFLTDDWILVEFDDSVRLFSKIIVSYDDDSEVDFDSILDTHTEKVDSFIPIPSSMNLALQRSMVVMSNSVHKECDFSINKKKLKIQAVSELADSFDTILLKKPFKDMKFKSDPSSLLRVLPYCEEVSFTEDCSILLAADGAFTHLIAHYQDEEE